MLASRWTGLSSEEARRRLIRGGANTLETKRESTVQKLRRYLVGPIPLMLLAAAFLSFLSGKVSDGLVILALFCINIAIQAWHEYKADAATKQLQDHLTVLVRVYRDAAWKEVPSRELVAGDMIELSVGAVVPADVSLYEARNLTLNDSMVTGESLPKEKNPGEKAFAGSFVATGRAVAEVTATGSRTYFGEALRAANAVTKRSALESDILTIARYLSIASLIAIVLLSAVLTFARAPILDIATLDLSLLIAGIPVALPTVMSLIISVGVLELAKKRAIVRRLSSLEDLANVSLLLSDKTGTLTQNALRVAAVETFGDYTELQALTYAYAIAERDHSPLDTALLKHAKESGAPLLDLVDLIPGDSERKRSTAVIRAGDRLRTLSLGAPQVVRGLSDMGGDDARRFETIVAEAAARGERVLALAIGNEKEEHLAPIALFSLSDTLRSDVPDVLAFLQGHGVAVKMLTGDSYPIANDVAKKLKLEGEVLPRTIFDDSATFAAKFEAASAFAEMLPKDKLTAVEAAKRHYTVAVTGDGVNDVPAVKAADVGIAVEGAVDALKSTADIVLLDNGLSVIKDAIVEARKVFMRLYHYSIFRISESFRVIVTIAIIGLLFKSYPLTPVQLILLALLNDIPVISIAFDRVRISAAPASIDVRGRFILSSLLGLTGVGNSMLMLWITYSYLHLPWEMIQTVFFLKLVVSGHMLLYVAHTDERWWRFFPSPAVILSVSATQALATFMAIYGVFTAAIPWQLAVFIWVWSFFWMQVSEYAKWLTQRREAAPSPKAIAFTEFRR